MASTRLQRKERKNRLVAKRRNAAIQRLNSKPVIKNVDIEKIKEEFAQGKINRPVDTGAETEAKPSKAEAKKAQKSEAKKADKPEPKKAEKAETKKSEPKTAEKPKAKNAEPAKEAAQQEDTNIDVDALLKSIGKAKESDKDDLKKINGIGPAFEKKLNGIGIYTYDQVSKLKKNDIENLSKVEGISVDKIESDNWVENAKNLMESNKGE